MKKRIIIISLLLAIAAVLIGIIVLNGVCVSTSRESYDNRG